MEPPTKAPRPTRRLFCGAFPGLKHRGAEGRPRRAPHRLAGMIRVLVKASTASGDQSICKGPKGGGGGWGVRFSKLGESQRIYTRFLMLMAPHSNAKPKQVPENSRWFPFERHPKAPHCGNNTPKLPTNLPKLGPVRIYSKWS